MEQTQAKIQNRLHEALGAAQTQIIVLTTYLEERDAEIERLNRYIAEERDTNS